MQQLSINNKPGVSWDDPIFDKFWATYRQSQLWAIRRLAEGNQMSRAEDADLFAIPPPPPPPPPVKCFCGKAKSYRNRRKNLQRKRRKQKKKEKEASLAQAKSMEIDLDTSVPIHPEYVEFLSQSIKHRLKRDNEKTEAESWLYEFSEFTPIDKVGINRRVVSVEESFKLPSEDFDEAKMLEMRALYGDRAEKIRSLECAVQVRFDAQFDKHNPPLWPNMPLNM